MSASVLVVITIGQAVFVSLLVALLVAHRVVGDVRGRRERGEVAAVARTINQWLTGELDEQAVRAGFEQLTFSELCGFLQRLSLQIGGEDWERLADLARQTSWFRDVRARATSRLWWRRLQATRALMVTASFEEEQLITNLLKDDRSAIRLAAAWCLHRVQSPGLSKAVLELATREPRIIRRQLLEVLSEDRRHVLGPLVEALTGATDREELHTSLTLAELLGVPSLLKHVLPHTVSRDLEVRIAATRALATYPHLDSSHALVRLLSDPAWQVRAQAAAALGTIGAREAVGDLDNALTDLNWWVRLRAALALRRLGDVGVTCLEQRRPEADLYAYEMARYVLDLEQAALAEYSGTQVVDFSDASSSGMAA